MSSEIATTLRKTVRRSAREAGGDLRVLTVRLLGPLTAAAGAVWAVVQPHRIAFLQPDGKGFYDFLVQPPLLVCLVGLVYALVVAPGLVQDLEEARREEHGPAA